MIKTSRNKTNDPSKVIFLNKKKYRLIKTYTHLMLILILTFFNYEAISKNAYGNKISNIGNNFSDNIINIHNYWGMGFCSIFVYSFCFGYVIRRNVKNLAKNKGIASELCNWLCPGRQIIDDWNNLAYEVEPSASNQTKQGDPASPASS